MASAEIPGYDHSQFGDGGYGGQAASRETGQAKPLELVQSGTAAFVGTLPSEVGGNYRGNLVGAVATLDAGEPLTGTRQRWDGTTVKLSVPAQAFREFIEGADPELQADIAYGASKIAAYAPMRAAVGEAVANPTRETRGTNVRVVWMEYGGEPLVVRDGSRGFLKHEELRTYRLSDAVPEDITIPRLKAVDFNGRRMVITEVPGDPVATVPLETRLALPDPVIEKAIDDLIGLDAAQLAIDPRHNNVLLDQSKNTIGFVDLHAKGDAEEPVAGRLFMLPDIVTTKTAGMAHGDAEDAAWADSYVAFGNRFLDIMERHYPEMIPIAAAGQAESNRGAWETMWGSRYFLGAYGLPDTPDANAFKRRLESLGLAGRGEQKATQHGPEMDGDVIG